MKQSKEKTPSGDAWGLDHPLQLLVTMEKVLSADGDASSVGERGLRWR